MRPVTSCLFLILLLVVCFSLGTRLEPKAMIWSDQKRNDNVFGVLFGDGRKLFANQFFTMADVYFHSGYYPSIFDRREQTTAIAAASHGHEDHDEDEKSEDFMGKSKDWIDAFGRRFRITEHTHLEHGNEREILPWLKLAADLDPQMTETYTVGSFWLREHLNQPKEAEAFLREGLRNNPDSYEIYFELGRLYDESYHDLDRARNAWLAALLKWNKLGDADKKENKLAYEEIIVHLGRLEENAGNYADAIHWLSLAKQVSPDPVGIQSQIDDLQQKLAITTNAPAR